MMVTIKYQFPNFSESEASRLAREYYGLSATAQPLPSERDQNFHLKTEDGQEFVLKIANATEQPELLELQNEVLEHLAAHAPDLSLSRVCRSLTDEDIFTITNSE